MGVNTLRPRELQTMCLWDFVAETGKVYRKKSNARQAGDVAAYGIFLNDIEGENSDDGEK
jgi:hypothetical protein